MEMEFWVWRQGLDDRWVLILLPLLIFLCEKKNNKKRNLFDLFFITEKNKNKKIKNCELMGIILFLLIL
jgi:hypothetical protein